MKYQTPVVFVVPVALFQSDSQYGIIMTAESCPNIANSAAAITLKGLQFLGCGEFSEIAGTQAQPNQTFSITCANLSGNYDLTYLNSETHQGIGMDCDSGQVTIVIPLEISPELPEDCVLDTLGSGSGDFCG